MNFIEDIEFVQNYNTSTGKVIYASQFATQYGAVSPYMLLMPPTIQTELMALH